MRLIVTQALQAIRANWLRAGITMVIIAIGIMALVGVLASIDAIKSSLSGSFSALGANTFRVQNRQSSVKLGGRGQNEKPFPEIEYLEAKRFQQMLRSADAVSLNQAATFTAKASYQDRKTNPNLVVQGGDANYLKTARFEIQEGRQFTPDEDESGAKVAIIGAEIKNKLFPYESAIGKTINVDNHIYHVIACLAEVGSSFGSSADEFVIIPMNTLRYDFSEYVRSFSVSVYVEDAARMGDVEEDARGIFRQVRGLKPGEADNFSFAKSDEFIEKFLENFKILTLSAIFITIVTMLGASVALLNVMLVSVTERTNEIGIRKALGATQNSILSQFLTEAILICQIGGFLGISLGLLAGNLVSRLLKNPMFIFPWPIIGLGVVLCLIVGVAAGIYPAWKAAKVDPIVSLRYE